MFIIYSDEPPPRQSHPWGIFFTIVGTVLLDFDADACQSPSRAYLLDVTLPGIPSRPYLLDVTLPGIPSRAYLLDVTLPGKPSRAYLLVLPESLTKFLKVYVLVYKG